MAEGASDGFFGSVPSNGSVAAYGPVFDGFAPQRRGRSSRRVDYPSNSVGLSLGLTLVWHALHGIDVGVAAFLGFDVGVGILPPD